MHTEQHYGTLRASSGAENAAEMWERLNGIWDAAIERAQKAGDARQAARAELTAGICKRERNRLDMMFRTRRA